MKYTFEQCVDNLNGMVEGLGDRFRENTDEWAKNYNYSSMNLWINVAFKWSESPEGHDFWRGISLIFKEAQL